MTDEPKTTGAEGADGDGSVGSVRAGLRSTKAVPDPGPGGAPVGVVVPAAGAGRRMGGVKKTFLELRGVPVLLHALRPFLARGDVVSVVVALAPEDAAEPPDWLAGADPRLHLVSGGATRSDSVRAGLAALPASVGVVLIHDGARPLVTGTVIDQCVAEARGGRGAVAGFPAVDTMKEVDDRHCIVRTPDRSRLWHAQTPQAFPRWMADEAYALQAGDLATDDASLVEGAGHPVIMVEAGPWNLKVTRPEDVAIADLILDRRTG